MAIISDDTIQRIQRESNLPQIIGEYTKVEQRGPDDYWCCCPFHNEKTPSFKITPSKGMYYCFGCHASGDAIKFVREMEKCSFPEAIENLAKKANIEIIYKDGASSSAEDAKRAKEAELKKSYIELYTRCATTFHYFLCETPQGKEALEYVKKRGLTMATIEKFKLGFSPADGYWLKNFLKNKNYSEEFLADSGLFGKNNKNFSFFHDRLMFPICNKNGDVVAFGGRLLHGDGPKYLNSGTLIHYQKGETLFAFNHAKKSIQMEKAVIFCEGYMDCIAYHQSGLTYAVAPLGTALTEDQVKLVKGFVKTVYLSFDSDEAGQAATFKAVIMLRKLGIDNIKVIVLKGGKDPAEIMLNFGIETLTNDVKNAILESDYLLSCLAKKYGDTPDGKRKTCMEYFQYIDSLPSEIQKTATLEKLSATYQIPMESIAKDYKNRNQDQIKQTPRDTANTQETAKTAPIVINAELRFMLSVASSPQSFSDVRNKVGPDDFDDPYAKDLYLVLEELFRRGDVSTNAISSYYADTNPKMSETITRSAMTGEFSENVSQAINDGIREVEIKRLKKQRAEIVMKMRKAELESNSALVQNFFQACTDIDKTLKRLEKGN